MVNIWAIIGHLGGEHCPLCQAAGRGLCADCRDALPRNERPCARCALPLPPGAATGAWCADCQRRVPSFDAVVAPLRYLPPVDDLLAGFKYHGRLYLGPLLAQVLGQALRQREPPQLLLPLPAAPRRLRERGFNQAAELTRWLSAHLGLPWQGGALIRTAESERQRGLTRRQRRRNVRGSFACRAELPAHVALVDDVVTTGATAEEACRVLRRAGATRVEVWAVARTPALGSFEF